MDVKKFLLSKQNENLSEEEISLLKKYTNEENYEQLVDFINAIKNYPKTLSLTNNAYKIEELLKMNERDFFHNLNLTKKTILRIESLVKQKFNNLYKELINQNLNKDLLYFMTEKTHIYKHLLKNKEIYPEKIIKSYLDNKEHVNFQNKYAKAIERINDDIEKAKIESLANKLERSVISNKYSHLVNDYVRNSFKECAKQNISKELLQKTIGKKIAAVKTPYQLDELINNAIGLNIDWSTKGMKQKIKEVSAEIIKEDNNKIYIEINDFNESSKLGSRMWCLTREEGYLNEYGYETNSRIIFVYDLNKDIKDDNSYTALLYKGSILESVFDKNDKELRNNDPIFKFFENENIPWLSETGLKAKKIKINNLINSNNFKINNLTIPMLLLTNNLENYIEHIGKKEYSNVLKEKLYNSERNQLYLNSLIEKMSFEQFEKLITKLPYQKLGEYDYSNSIELRHLNSFLKKANINDTKKAFEINKIHKKIEEISSKNEPLSKQIKYFTLMDNVLGLNKENFELVKNKLIENNIDISSLLLIKSNKIKTENIESILSIEKNAFEKAFPENYRVLMINLMNDGINVETFKKAIDSINKEDLELRKKSIEVFLSKISEEKNPFIYKEKIKILNDVFKNEQKNKNKFKI